MNAMKTKFTLLIALICALSVSAVNVTIIESQTGNDWAVQDSNWHIVATGMGYTASVVSQSALDEISNFNNTDVLIVSSGTISFPSSNRLQTIRQFVLSGRAVYIQSEYLDTYQGNITFDSLMHTVGANFSWTSLVSGLLVPMNVLGSLSSTPNAVSSIMDFFNYGYAGTGTGVEMFLEYNGNYFGFCYSDSTLSNGTIITTSDEDWVWYFSSPELMENILYKLANSVNASVQSFEKTDSSFTIYPNPCTTEAQIKMNRFCINATIEIYNLYGQLVKQISSLSGQTFTVERGNLASGTYFVRVTQDNKIISTDKLVFY